MTQNGSIMSHNVTDMSQKGTEGAKPNALQYNSLIFNAPNFTPFLIMIIT